MLKGSRIVEIAEVSILSDAFQRVKENRGCAGVDGVTIEEFESDLEENLAKLRDEIL